ncbi:UBP1-associated protein 2B [Daucus carota subsp. sativus]|uniref:RRM domain-containing protein n=2 Tax=Daucus carota subsp. sativus TaxID=79200 RepID=A0A175YGR1_DAUCS|nr:PREDICTED: UBP1-associated protein 2B-like [Daucus carota subsp. sativus]
MTKEKSKLQKEAHKPELKTLKRIKKRKPLEDLTPDSDSMKSTRNKKKKHKSDEPISSNPEKLETLKKKHKSDKPQKSHSESDSVHTLEKEEEKKKTKKITHDSDSIQIVEKKKKKNKSDKPQKPRSAKPEILGFEIDADSVPSPRKKKRKSDTHSIESRKKEKKQKLDRLQSTKPKNLDSEIEDVSIQTPKKKKKQKWLESQKPIAVVPEILDSEIDSDSIQSLLEPHTKDQLIEFLLDSAVKTPSILFKIMETANEDISHRRIFVHNIDWDTTRGSMVSVFEKYGALEACDVAYDRVTGKTKGFGFVVFKSRESAKNALKEPKKRIDNRIASCQLASIGPPVVGGVDNSSRKIYVSNVDKDVDSLKLREFFEKFGEIEVGPFGFDMQTGKSKGYALFVYKNLEGVRKVLEEPIKIFDGKQLSCRMANDWNGRKKNSKSDSSVTTVMMPVPHDLSAVLPEQNMAMVGQPAGFNPMLGQLGFNTIAEGLYANPSAALLNQLLSQPGIGVNQFGQMGVGLGGYGEAMTGQVMEGLGCFGETITGQEMGDLGWNQSVLGPFSGRTSSPMLQGWQHAYSDT